MSEASRLDASAQADETPRVLVVDDNPDSADSLGMLLEILGATVTVAYDGQTALQCLQSQPIDIAFLDIGMPGMDGYEVARRARQSIAARNLYLIALTGWGLEEHRRESQAAGFDHHLVKPADIEALEAALKAAAAARDSTERR